MAKIRVNKVDAARRQIDVAIRLLFDNVDPVAVHTLAWAGGRILRDICELKGTPGHLANKAMIRPGMERKLWAVMGRAANFLKHADRDADEILDDVEEEINDATLMMAIMSYQDLGYQPTTEMNAFLHWYFALNPDMLGIGSPEQISLVRNLDLQSLPRAEQLAGGKHLLAVAKGTGSF